MPLQSKSAITRNWKATFIYLIGGLLLIGITVLLCMYFAYGLISGTLSILPGLLGLMCLYVAISGAGEANCPACSKPLDALSTGSNDGIFCSNCKHYFEGKNAELWATDDSRIADSPLFSTIIPEKFLFPDQCCVCGKPATQKIKISLTTTNASSALTQSTIGITSTTTTSVEVPHCADHKDGALLTGTKDKTEIKFRSYPYLRQFCQTNNTEPK